MDVSAGEDHLPYGGDGRDPLSSRRGIAHRRYLWLCCTPAKSATREATGLSGATRPHFTANCLPLPRSTSGTSSILITIFSVIPKLPCNDRSTNQRDELAPSHSITSSAATSRAWGIVRPNALAVLRLITNSNLVGNCFGP